MVPLELDPRLTVTQWVAPELGNCSYVVTVRGEGSSAVIDPLRDVDGYLARLPRSEREVLLALETHIHNDFISGARELASSAGAEIGSSAVAELTYSHRPLRDREEVRLGGWKLQVLATPGHTPEHVSYLLVDPGGKPVALFSGGALTVGGAGRTDLLGPLLARPLARDLHRSIHERLLHLPGDVRLLPTHGGGSFCSAECTDRRVSTVREEKASNPLIRARTLDEFVSRILEQGPFPQYFRRMRALNSAGVRLFGGACPTPRALGLEDFDRARAEGAIVLDTRTAPEHDQAHVPGGYAIGADGPMSAWVGWLFSPERAILLLSRDEREAREATRQLFRIGFDRVVGFLAGGFETWADAGRPVASTKLIEAPALVERLRSEEPLVVVDVREAHEWFRGHVPGSLNIPLATLPQRSGEVPRDAPVVVHCAYGYRADIAAGILEQAGFTRVLRLVGGYEDWCAAASRRQPS
ncbi:MAG: MBL fold metallo-hydrolase [Euryarchaeota archaeon]|nr:MBL fold metallo-hydrolase [Euryarchaeota archaeon]MDE1835548.1 MBL fold metallo-hydrolase [Euryarchaeota archaeon]MDE1879639.1 MBL fold metallo-hydrolase [Euryarchaeota archaeon]MDE2043830.1 MBL fold metallo-hydrolase [Thermoplasmata archaeon]